MNVVNMHEYHRICKKEDNFSKKKIICIHPKTTW